jgi:hypothetical protein
MESWRHLTVYFQKINFIIKMYEGYHHHQLPGLGPLTRSDLPVRQTDPSISSVVDPSLFFQGGTHKTFEELHRWQSSNTFEVAPLVLFYFLS